MAFLIPTGTANGSIGVGPTDDGIYIGSAVQVQQTFTNTQDKVFIIDGTVAGNSWGVFVDFATANVRAGATIEVGASGIIRAFGGQGIFVDGFDSEIVNHGLIVGGTGFEAISINAVNAATATEIVNHGTIEGDPIAIARWTGSTEGLSIENHGTIRGRMFSFQSFSTTGQDGIVNEGTMIGAINFAGGDDFYFGTNGRFSGGAINGGDGEDFLIGGVNPERLFGGGDDDSISGMGGNDELDGGPDEDVLFGGAGRDRLTGGGDDDVFLYSKTSDSTNTLRDTITDFSRAQRDEIDLSLIDASTRAAGNQAFKFIGSAAFTKVAGQLRFQKVGSDTLIQGDTNGDGKADLVIVSDIAMTFIRGDFVL
jgi:Ca2+-binding RTX toxin-like protein